MRAMIRKGGAGGNGLSPAAAILWHLAQLASAMTRPRSSVSPADTAPAKNAVSGTKKSVSFKIERRREQLTV